MSTKLRRVQTDYERARSRGDVERVYQFRLQMNAIVEERERLNGYCLPESDAKELRSRLPVRQPRTSILIARIEPPTKRSPARWIAAGQVLRVEGATGDRLCALDQKHLNHKPILLNTPPSDVSVRAIDPLPATTRC